MSSATGLSVMDVAVLDALDHVGATPDRYVKNKRVLDEAFQCHNIPPRPGYQVLCDLSRSWVVHLPLVDFHGNAGSPDFGPASPLYTESRLSPLGAAALAAERGEIGPLPIGLINGNTYVDGPKPPFDPTRILAGVRSAAAGGSDEMIAATVGAPSFPGGCRVQYDHERLVTGIRTRLDVCANVAAAGPGLIRITSIPSDINSGTIVLALEHRAEHPPPERPEGWPALPPRLPIRNINDQSADGRRLLEVTLEPEADDDAVIAEIEGIWGVHTEIDVTLGQPLARILRDWVDFGSRDDLDDRLAIIANAIRG